MKKLLATLMLTPLTLTACFGASGDDDWDVIQDGDDYILATVGKDGVDEIKFKASDFFDYIEGTQEHYDQVFEKMDYQLTKTIYILDAFTDERIGQEKFDELYEEKEEELRVEKDAVKSTHGSGWEDVWNDQIEEAGYDDEIEYMEKTKVLEPMQTRVSEMFTEWKDKNEDSLIDDPEWEWGSVQIESFDRMFSATKPISMRHVLVKFDVDFTLKNPFEKAEINYTEEAFDKLKEAGEYLVAANSSAGTGIDWNEFAEDHSEDGSAKTGGHFKFEGINSLTSVDEFKFASYDLAYAKYSNYAGSNSTLIADFAAITPETSSTWGQVLNNVGRESTIVDVNGELVAIVISQYGIHFIGVDGIDGNQLTDGANGEDGYRQYVLDRAEEEKNHPNSGSKAFHTDVTTALTSFKTSYNEKTLLDFAIKKEYISFPDEGQTFKEEFLGKYEQKLEVDQYSWIKILESQKTKWFEDEVRENPLDGDTGTTMKISIAELESFLEDENIWGTSWGAIGASHIKGGNN